MRAETLPPGLRKDLERTVTDARVAAEAGAPPPLVRPAPRGCRRSRLRLNGAFTAERVNDVHLANDRKREAKRSASAAPHGLDNAKES